LDCSADRAPHDLLAKGRGGPIAPLGVMMRYEPAIDRARVTETLRHQYGLAVDGLSFIPVGFSTACYEARAAGGERYFLKLWPNPRIRDDKRQAIVLRLLRAFHERGLEPRVPYPIATRNGALSTNVDGTPLAVFPFLYGRPLPEDPPPALAEATGRTIAAIHRATPMLTDVLPPRETFTFPGEPELRRALVQIEAVASTARPGLRALRRLVLPRRDEILSRLARLHELGDVARRFPSSFVLCHTDMGGDNALVDEDGRLTVLDWDLATVAPPEHDLWWVPERALVSYLDAGGARPLDLDRFAFYILRRGFEDMTARLVRMLDDGAIAHEDEELLGGIETWGFAQWAGLDARLAQISGAMRYQDRSSTLS
jgi:Ser/Thr protein kinase RdoA (MazF antagonist)